METKFYVGQRVRSNTFGEGVVYKTTSFIEDLYPVSCKMDNGRCYSFTEDGRRIINQDIDLIPLDPPRAVLTEWQKQKLKDHFLYGYKLASQGMDWYSLADDNLTKIESIISEPEPPKFVPKDGEAVLVKAREADSWQAYVSNGKGMQVYGCLGVFKFVRPFDPALVGKVTND